MRGKIKPSKPASIVQMIMALIFTIIGITVVMPAIKESDGPVWFGVLWTLVAIGLGIQAAVNAFSEEGLPTEEFTTSQTPAPTSPPAKTAEDRLAELATLKEKGLLEPHEYEAKRREIIDDL